MLLWRNHLWVSSLKEEFEVVGLVACIFWLFRPSILRKIALELPPQIVLHLRSNFCGCLVLFTYIWPLLQPEVELQRLDQPVVAMDNEIGPQAAPARPLLQDPAHAWCLMFSFLRSLYTHHTQAVILHPLTEHSCSASRRGLPWSLFFRNQNEERNWILYVVVLARTFGDRQKLLWICKLLFTTGSSFLQAVQRVFVCVRVYRCVCECLCTLTRHTSDDHYYYWLFSTEYWWRSFWWWVIFHL